MTQLKACRGGALTVVQRRLRAAHGRPGARAVHGRAPVGGGHAAVLLRTPVGEERSAAAAARPR